eukprot:2948297-Prymnesium_polylepis.2
MVRHSGKAAMKREAKRGGQAWNVCASDWSPLALRRSGRLLARRAGRPLLPRRPRPSLLRPMSFASDGRRSTPPWSANRGCPSTSQWVLLPRLPLREIRNHSLINQQSLQSA